MKRLHRKGVRRTISLVPLVDVLLILLVFFMVTSRYEPLAAVPIVTAAGAASGPPTAAGATELLRLDAEGRAWTAGSGRALDAAGLAAFFADHRGARFRVLASPEARTQGLVTLAEMAASAGVRDLRLIRVVEER